MKKIISAAIILLASAADPAFADQVTLKTIIPDQTILRAKKGVIGDTYSNPAIVSDGAIPSSGLLVEGDVKIVGKNTGAIGAPANPANPDLELYNMNTDDRDVHQRFHCGNLTWYSMGIDRSDSGKFKINRGQYIVDNADFTMDTAGNIGIGTSSPGSYKLYVNGPIFATNLHSPGTPGTNDNSDIRLKKNVEQLTAASEKLKNIKGVEFDWRVDEFPDKKLPDGKQIGMIAQEVEKEFPELVSTDSDGYKSIFYDKFTAVLLEAIKEQSSEIASLKKRIEALEAKK